MRKKEEVVNPTPACDADPIFFDHQGHEGETIYPCGCAASLRKVATIFSKLPLAGKNRFSDNQGA
jgi:hypothetical protein